ncbi:hypothetical protein Tco_0487241 [Tanacetum coccineum]
MMRILLQGTRALLRGTRGPGMRVESLSLREYEVVPEGQQRTAPIVETVADGAQRPLVPAPFPEDPYKAIRQAYLVQTKAPKSLHTVASPTPLPESTPLTRHAKDSVDSDTSGARSTPSDSTAPLSPDHPLTYASPTFVPILCRTAHMAVRVLPAMSPGLSASI